MLIDDDSDRDVETPREKGKIIIAWGKLRRTA
jgi:hypothetical protein